MSPLIQDEFSLDLDALTVDEAKRGDLVLSCPTWHTEIQGSVCRFFRMGVKVPLRPDSERKIIGIWSMQSRMRLLRLLNKIDYPMLGPSVFVTLTYPDRVQVEGYGERSQHRAVFLRYVEKYLSRNVACIWRIEWEERKSGAYTGKLAPHFHLMLLNVPFLPHERVREWWRQAIQAGDGPLVSEVKRIKNVNGVARYLSKYVSKYRSLDISTYHNSPIKFGRHWGVCRPELVPLCPVRVARQLTKEEVAQIQAFARRRWPMYDENGSGGFTLLGEKFAKRFGKWLDLP